METDCEQGLCGTCKVKLISGELDMETDDGLDEADLEHFVPFVGQARS